jgi:hypothetical protein
MAALSVNILKSVENIAEDEAKVEAYEEPALNRV